MPPHKSTGPALKPKEGYSSVSVGVPPTILGLTAKFWLVSATMELNEQVTRKGRKLITINPNMEDRAAHDLVVIAFAIDKRVADADFKEHLNQDTDITATFF